ncbi:MAG: aldo/keto reductase [Pseudomonadales bacterium]|nr:aldo/keto reductase [Pseudomonadales bacterium]
MTNTNLLDTSPRQLGDQTIGPLAYGCWRLVNMSVDGAQARIECALEHGMNLVDTADVYGLDWGGTAFGSAEELLGGVLKQKPELRRQMVLASKGGIIPGVPYDSGYLEAACEASLRRLGVEQLDLYQIHRPDMLSHPEETAAILDRLLTSGKIRQVGVSNHAPTQTSALMTFLPGKIISQQSEYSALHLAPLFDGTFDQCMQHEQTMLAWSPLGGGTLTELGGVPASLDKVLERLATREDVDRATLCLAFVLAHPAKPVAIVGSIDQGRIASARNSLKVKLTRTDVYEIIQASMGEDLP